MRLYDLILMRMFLTSIMAGFLLCVFILLRKHAPRWLTGHLRRWIWLSILLLSCCFIPVPAVCHIPADAPDWLYAGRLPDPDTPILNQTLIDEAKEASGALINGTYGNGESLQVEPSQIKPGAPYNWSLPRLTLKGWFIRLIHQWRWIWPAGFALFLAVRLLKWLRGKRITTDQKMDGDNQPDQESWQQEIAVFRDELGYYRYADIIMSGEHDDRILTFLRHWRRHQIPVPLKSPAEMPDHERRHFICLALDRNNRPNLLLLLLLFIVRSLIWYNPFWLTAEHDIKDDLELLREERLNAKQDRSRKKEIHLLPAAGTAFVFLICLILLAWQSPAVLLPDIAAAAQALRTAGQPMMIQISEQLPTELSFANGHFLCTENELALLRDETGRYYLTQPSSDGKNWQIGLQQLIAGQPELESLSGTINYAFLSDTRHLSDQSWSVILSIVINDQSSLCYLRLSNDGRSLLSGFNLNRLYDVAASELTSFTLMPDGGWINWSNHQSSLAVIERRAADGSLIWSRMRDDPDVSAWQMTDIQAFYAIQQRMIGMVIPTSDAGCYLIIYGYTAVYLNQMDDNKAVGNEQPNVKVFREPNQVVRINPEGKMLWITNLPSGEKLFFASNAAAGDDDSLYMLGAMIWQTPEFVFPSAYDYRQAHLLALSPDGQIGWQQTFYYPEGSSGADFLVQPDQISVLVFSQPDTANQPVQIRRTIWQLDRSGKLLHQSDSDRYHDIAYVLVKSGQVLIPGGQIVPDEAQNNRSS